MRKIGYDELLTTLTEIVSESPDYVYEAVDVWGNCRYTHYGQPSCLIGRALHHLGFSIFELEMFDAQDDSSVRNLGVCEDGKALTLAIFVQENQDGGLPWGKALEDAVNEVKREESRNNEA